MSTNTDSSYYNFLFEKILDAIRKTVIQYDNYWFKSAPSEKEVAFQNLLKFDDEQKREFVFMLVLIHGVFNSSSLRGVIKKRIGNSRMNTYFDIDLPFENEDQIAEYIVFRNRLVYR